MANTGGSGYEKQRRQMRDGGDNPGATGSAPHNKSLRLDKIAQGSRETRQHLSSKDFLEVPQDPRRPQSRSSGPSSRSSGPPSELSMPQSRSSGPPSRPSELPSGSDSEAIASQRSKQKFVFPDPAERSPHGGSSGQISRTSSNRSSELSPLPSGQISRTPSELSSGSDHRAIARQPQETDRGESLNFAFPRMDVPGSSKLPRQTDPRNLLRNRGRLSGTTGDSQPPELEFPDPIKVTPESESDRHSFETGS